MNPLAFQLAAEAIAVIVGTLVLVAAVAALVTVIVIGLGGVALRASDLGDVADDLARQTGEEE